MREIKFRAWDKGAEKMVNEVSFPYIKGYMGDEGCVDCTAHFFETTSKKFEWMQFTGLKDKNGKEIYEGDIVEEKKNWLESGSGEDEKRILQIKFANGGFIVSENGRGQDLRDHLNCEIIGNIYENSELLK